LIRTRRVSILIRQTEVTASVSQVFAPGADASPLPLPAANTAPGLCPDCGSPCSLRFLDIVRDLELTAALIKAAADQGRLHLLCSPDNQVWICDRSLQQMKENS
jgi:hypothetical protein